MQLNSHCWICEGWTAIDFEICTDEYVDIDTVPVKLHISCDNYKGETLALNEEKSGALNKKLKHEADERERIRVEKEYASNLINQCIDLEIFNDRYVPPTPPPELAEEEDKEGEEEDPEKADEEKKVTFEEEKKGEADDGDRVPKVVEKEVVVDTGPKPKQIFTVRRMVPPGV